MDLPDSLFSENLDWDPSYLSLLFKDDFYDFTELWRSNISDIDLVNLEKKWKCILQLLKTSL